MKLSNRCPECGGVTKHIVTDISGKNYYQCWTGLTTFEVRGGEVQRESQIMLCENILSEQGELFTGTIAYKAGNETRILAVTDGKERR